MANRHMKRCSILLIIRDMQIKLTMTGITSHLSEWPSLKSTNNKCWRGCGGKGTLADGNVNLYSHCESSMEIL